MLYIGIDLGTSSVKAILMASNGTIINTASKSYPIYYPKEGWSEQDPEDWHRAVWDCIKELCKRVERSRIAGIGVSGQMHGLVVLDGYNNVIRRALLWNDGRASSQCDYLNTKIGRKHLVEMTGNIAFAGFTAPKLLWMKENENESFQRINKIMLPKDYIVFRLTGNHCSDYSDASGTLLLNVKEKKWSLEMLELCSVKECHLPKLFESHEVVGTITNQVAKELDLPSSVLVVAGAADNAASAVGVGVVGDGNCSISLGTSGTVLAPFSSYLNDGQGRLHVFAGADGGFYLMGCVLSAASSYKWWINEILKHDLGTTFPRKNVEQTACKRNLFFLPYLTGERSPHNDPSARGAFIGMSVRTTQEDMTFAVLEGVAFALRDSIEIARTNGLKIDCARLSGGGSKNDIWRNILANCLKIDIEVPLLADGGCFGSALLAAVGCGEFRDVKSAANTLVNIKSKEKPDGEIVEQYEQSYKIYKTLYPSLKDVFKIMNPM